MKTTIQLGTFSLDPASPAFIIAEAGVNHNGNLETAKALVRAAKKAGADCVKFQTFRAEDIVTAAAPKADYQLKTTGSKESQLAMLKSLELPENAFAELKHLCDAEGIFFLSTPYSFTDVDLLARMGVEAYKIASGQLTEYPFVEYVARQGKPIILSTGMSDLEDVRGAVEAVQRAGNDRLILLQCTTNYPSLPEDCHLRAMDTLAREFGVPAGYSDHTMGSLAILAAVAKGARVIEKHLTLDRAMPGPDHACSIEPAELQKLVVEIRQVERMLGRPEKKPTAAEARNALGMKRSIVAAKRIAKGSVITRDMLIFKRPFTGIAPKDMDRVVGARANVDIMPDTILTADMIQLRDGVKIR